MAKLEFAGGMIQRVKELTNKTGMSADMMAYYGLMEIHQTNTDNRPAWNTGLLRKSGSAYAGSRLIATTTDQGFKRYGRNPNGSWKKSNRPSYNGRRPGASWGSVKKGMKPVYYKGMRANYVKPYANAQVNTVRDSVTFFYKHPVAALMHEWRGGFSSPDSNRKYITYNFRNVWKRYVEILKFRDYSVK